MTNANLDNSVDGMDVVLWQYDKAVRFVQFVEKVVAGDKVCTEQFWNYIGQSVFDLAQADSFGLSVWGLLLGKGRVTVTTTVQGDGGSEKKVTAPISDELYRKVLLATLRHLPGNRSKPDIDAYLHEIFNGRVVCTDNLDMSLSHEWVGEGDEASEEKALFEQHPDYVLLYPAGVREKAEPEAAWFGFDGQEEAVEGRKIQVVIGNFGEDRTFVSQEIQDILGPAPAAESSDSSDGNQSEATP